MAAILLVSVFVSEIMYSLGFGAQNMILLHLLAVLIISFNIPNYVYGVLAALISAFAYDFLFSPPRMEFSFAFELPITLLIMLEVAFITGTMAMNMRETAHIAQDREYRAQQLYDINQKLLAARDLDTITRLAVEYLNVRLKRPATLYTRAPGAQGGQPRHAGGDPPAPGAPFNAREQAERVHELFLYGENDRQAYSSGHNGAGIFNAPLISKGKVLGVISIDCSGGGLEQNDLSFVRMLAGQVALALELQYLSDEREHILIEAEKEKTRAMLLRSISHDLRTPLTAIHGASSAILEQKDLDAATVERLVRDISADAQWLIRVVENILMITKISGNNLKLRMEPEAAEEVAAVAVSIVRGRFPGHVFSVNIPDELILARMDATLISQVLINLLENAAKNSPPDSEIITGLTKQDGYAKFAVTDNGCGISASMADKLFEAVAGTGTQTADATRGMGIGLSICKTIVQAHGGSIEGGNRVDGHGAVFSFLLPLYEEVPADG